MPSKSTKLPQKDITEYGSMAPQGKAPPQEKSEREKEADVLARTYKKHTFSTMLCQYKLFNEMPFALGPVGYKWIYFGKDLCEKLGIECYKLASAIATKKKGVVNQYTKGANNEDLAFCYGSNLIAPHEEPGAYDIDADADIVNKKIRLWIDLNLTQSDSACNWIISHLRKASDGKIQRIEEGQWRRLILDREPAMEELIDAYVDYIAQFTVLETKTNVRSSHYPFELLMPWFYMPSLLPGDYYAMVKEARKGVHILGVIGDSSRPVSPSTPATGKLAFPDQK